MIKINLKKYDASGGWPYMVGLSIETNNEKDRRMVDHIPGWALKTVQSHDEKTMYVELGKRLGFIQRQILNSKKCPPWKHAVVEMKLSM